MHLTRGVNKPTNSLPSTGNPPSSKGIPERLASELSDSSTESAMMSMKKPVMPTTAPNGHGSGGGGGGINSTSSTTSNLSKGGPLQQSHQNALAVPEGLEVHRRPSAGMIKVKLASASPQWDNKAEVEVDCENPDEVVDKMLQSIVDKFPPNAVISVEKGGKPVHIPGQQQSYPHSLAGSPTHSQGPAGSLRQGTADRGMSGGYPAQGPKPNQWGPRPNSVPQLSCIDKYEEVEEIHEVIKHVPKYEVVDVPRQVVKYVPKIVAKIVENIVEVPRGEKIPVMRPQPVDTAFVVPKFTDRNVPVVMSQCIIPEIEETDEVVEVEVSKYVPYLVPVDVYVPLPVTIPVHQKSGGEQTGHPCPNTDPALLQHLMIEMNPHLQQLEMFNFQQQEQFQALINQSIQQARENGVAPPQPINNPTTVQQGPLPASANGTGRSQRCKSELSRSSSAGASGRHPSRSVSRRISGIGHGRSSSQVPPTMTVAPPQFQGYPPMYGSAPPPMMFHPNQQMQQMPPTLHSPDGFGQAGMYGYTNGSAGGMMNTLPGAPPTMMMSQPPRVNLLGPDSTATAQSDKLGQTSRINDLSDNPSRQQSGAILA
eukprot:GHVS01036264.1.p1 GENE.GHVS01036264.1~~GHVS01036264.1.p1  ORF type:complete len:595 (+),score=71.76 GHVS01036264.1:220-2004(+)